MTMHFISRTTVFCVTSLLLLETSRALDLTPHADFIHGNEGSPVAIIQVADGDRKIIFVPPHEWLPDGSAHSLSLSAPGASEAWMKLVVVAKQDPLPAPLNPSAKPEDLQAWAAQYLPQGAQDVTFVKKIDSAFMVCSHPGTELIFSFVRYGSRDSISISSVDFSATEQLVAIVASQSTDFERARMAAIRSLFSWHYK